MITCMANMIDRLPTYFNCFFLPTSLFSPASARPVHESLVHGRSIFTEPCNFSFILSHPTFGPKLLIIHILAYLNGEIFSICFDLKSI